MLSIAQLGNMGDTSKRKRDEGSAASKGKKAKYFSDVSQGKHYQFRKELRCTARLSYT